MLAPASESQSPWAMQLRRFRRAHALKQIVLAEMMGVDQTTISRWESGRQVPDFSMQRRLRDLIHKMPGAEDVAKHAVEMAMGQAVLTSPRRVVLAASKAYSAAHGVTQNGIRGMCTRPMYTEEGEALWQTMYMAGFYRGELASVTGVARAHALSDHRSDILVKVVWTPLRISEDQILLRGERLVLTEEEFDQNRRAIGGLLQMVTMDGLVG